MKKYIIIFSIFLFLFNSYSLRMVTVGSGITEIIYALGIESNLVGNCVSSNYPDEANHLQRLVIKECYQVRE